MNIHKHGFFQNGRPQQLSKLTGMIVCGINQRQSYWNCYARLTSSLLLPSQAYNSIYPFLHGETGLVPKMNGLGNVEEKYTTDEGKQGTVDTFRIACCIIDVHC